MSRELVILAALFAAHVLATPVAAGDKDGAAVKLFNGKDLSGWKIFVEPKSKVKPETVWSVKDGIIICKGQPLGYLITEKDYSNYILKVQWRWTPDSDNNKRNSGVFVHVSGEDKIWPKGVEAQLYRDHAGDFWLVDGFKLTVDKDRQNPKSPTNFYRMKKSGVEKPIGEWNQYEITCKGNTIKLVVNDVLQNEGAHAESDKGKILLQSEGAEIHFRNIELIPIRGE
jgi:3-keto-disaccharide hydrolase